MKVIAVNGSPRKGWNTHMMLEKAVDGAKSRGAETELINLYDYSYKGCISCLGCKRKDGKPGRCVIRDDISPILDRIHECDALILGSPIYFDEVSGALRSFMERLLFQYISYNTGRVPLWGREIKTGFVFTTNCPEPFYGEEGYVTMFADYKALMERIFLGECRTIYASETLQTNDYDKHHMSMFDVPARKQRREEIFPLDLQKAFELGAWLAE